MQPFYRTVCRAILSILIATALFPLLAPLEAQIARIDRPFQPVVLKGDTLREFSGNVALLNQLFLYKYSSANNSWSQVPFQFDEVEADSLDSTKTTYFRRGDSKLDNLDELAFMARDLGDKAPTNAWLDDASSRAFARYEIELTDPLSIGSAGYLYLFRSTTLTVPPAITDYVTYVPPALQKGNDVIKGQSYIEGHLDNGITDSLLVPVSENGSGVNFLDRLKLRFQINIGIPLTFVEDNFTLIGLSLRDGRVRIIRELRERISLLGNNIDFPIQIQYYGYSSVLATTFNLTNLPGTVSVTLLRQSFDFAPNVSGAKWYNQNITNAIVVNGSAGNLSPAQAATVTEPNFNWYMLSSAQHGSFINIFSLPGNLGTTRRFYFHDAASGTADGTSDTGDQKSYGDSGFLATASAFAQTIYNLSFTSYVLGKDQPRSMAETLHNQTSKPLILRTRSQRSTVAVEQTPTLVPERFALLQNSPNPVSLAVPSTVIRYELPFAGSTPVSLRIFNLLGQNVHELVNATQPSGRYEVQWDGRLENGERAPAGIYFYQLRAGNQVATQKLMVLSK